MNSERIKRRAVEFVNELEIAVEDGMGDDDDGLLRVALRFRPQSLMQSFDETALETAKASDIVVASAAKMATFWADWLLERVPVEKDGRDADEFREVVGEEIAERLMQLVLAGRKEVDVESKGE